MRGSHINKAAVAAEQERAFTLRLGGATYRQIGEALGIPRATAHRRVTDACAERVAPGLEEYRKVEDERLDTLLRRLAPKLATGEVPAIEAARRIGESRRRLWGMDAPVVSEIHLDARVDVEIEATVTATAAAIAAVLAALAVEPSFAVQLERYGLLVASRSLAPDPAAVPEPEAPRRMLALMPGSGSDGPSDGLPDGPGPMVPTEGLTAAEQAELAALLGSMEDDGDAA